MDYLEDGVYLVVRKPVGKGKMVDESEVLDTIRKKQIKSFDAKVISYVVKTASGVAEKIAPPQTPEKINATVAISVSEDKMRAFMTIYPPIGGKDLSIQDRITSYNVCYTKLLREVQKQIYLLKIRLLKQKK